MTFFATLWAGAAALAVVCACIVWRLRVITGRWAAPLIVGIAVVATPLFFQLLIIGTIAAECTFWHACL